MTSVEIGDPLWGREAMLEALPAFEEVYARRPIVDNVGGMKAPHMFAAWFIARHLDPPVVIESGTWRGQGTWLLEQACPDAKIFSIDVDLSHRDYISERATYFETDFAHCDWSGVDAEALVFFDDHQNAYQRLQQCRWLGFRDVIFEDNYPASSGDCYSLKKVFEGVGFMPATSGSLTRARNQLAKIVAGGTEGMPAVDHDRVLPNDHDAKALRRNLEFYREFPPVFRTSHTRWGDAWVDSEYPTPPALLDPSQKDQHPVLWAEAEHYTWLCYARLTA